MDLFLFSEGRCTDKGDKYQSGDTLCMGSSLDRLNSIRIFLFFFPPLSNNLPDIARADATETK